MSRKDLSRPALIFAGGTYFAFPPNGEYGLVEVINILDRQRVEVKEAALTGMCATSDSTWRGIIPMNWLYDMPKTVCGGEES